MAELLVGGDRLYFSDQGTGEPIIFVHGSCGGGAQWRGLSGLLKDTYRVVCPDLFGCGDSEPWPLERVWTLKDDERAINAVLAEINEPVHLVVHSGGGRFIHPTVSKQQNHVLSITFFEPTHFQLLRHCRDPLFSEPEEMANVFRSIMDAGNRDKAMERFVDLWARAEGTWVSLPEPVQNLMRRGANRLYHEWALIWHDEPTMDDLVSLEVPVLLVKGDSTIPSMHRVCHFLRQSNPTWRYVEISGAGHMCPFTHYAEVIGALNDHLARIIHEGYGV